MDQVCISAARSIQSGPNPSFWTKDFEIAFVYRGLERAMGIEPTSEAWEACNITQKHAGLAAFSQFSERLNWKIMENGKRLSSLMNPEH